MSQGSSVVYNSQKSKSSHIGHDAVVGWLIAEICQTWAIGYSCLRVDLIRTSRRVGRVGGCTVAVSSV